MVQIHVGNGRNADARWLGDVDDVDAHARSVMVLHHNILPCYVGCYDAGHDAAIPGTHAVTLSSGRSENKRVAFGLAYRLSGVWLFSCLEYSGVGCFYTGC